MNSFLSLYAIFMVFTTTYGAIIGTETPAHENALLLKQSFLSDLSELLKKDSLNKEIPFIHSKDTRNIILTVLTNSEIKEIIHNVAGRARALNNSLSSFYKLILKNLIFASGIIVLAYSASFLPLDIFSKLSTSLSWPKIMTIASCYFWGTNVYRYASEDYIQSQNHIYASLFFILLFLFEELRKRVPESSGFGNAHQEEEMLSHGNYMLYIEWVEKELQNLGS
ncbi:MAG TPA: hypothetical protein VHA52_06485 [Candidatus Babeliaceae bacterium]|nr:hypothetical protein [Candidatus Babeliaceae bacterium]